MFWGDHCVMDFVIVIELFLLVVGVWAILMPDKWHAFEAKMVRFEHRMIHKLKLALKKLFIKKGWMN